MFKNNTLWVVTQICLKNNSLEDQKPAAEHGSRKPNLICISVSRSDAASIIYWWRLETRKIHWTGGIVRYQMCVNKLIVLIFLTGFCYIFHVFYSRFLYFGLV